jgi:hypothetical protein
VKDKNAMEEGNEKASTSQFLVSRLFFFETFFMNSLCSQGRSFTFENFQLKSMV